MLTDFQKLFTRVGIIPAFSLQNIIKYGSIDSGDLVNVRCFNDNR